MVHYCAVCSVQCAVCSVQCAVCSVQCLCLFTVILSALPHSTLEAWLLLEYRLAIFFFL